jgi:hypothetical protein
MRVARQNPGRVNVMAGVNVMVGVNSLAIVYESVTLSRTVIERIEFDELQRGEGGGAAWCVARGILSPIGLVGRKLSRVA